MARYKSKFESQLGKKVTSAGTHIPHAVLGLVLKKRRKKDDYKLQEKGGSSVRPLKEYNPFPADNLPGSY